MGHLAANQSYPESSLSTYAIIDFERGFKLRHDVTYDGNDSAKIHMLGI